LKATADGIPTASLVAVAEVEPEGMLLAFDHIVGDTLEGAGPEVITDEILHRVWRVAAELQDHHQRGRSRY
jgi:hypothetical protein